MHGRFTLTIELGNDAMQTPQDISVALRDASDTLGAAYEISELEYRSLEIYDFNGNRVGEWRIDTEEGDHKTCGI